MTSLLINGLNEHGACQKHGQQENRELQRENCASAGRAKQTEREREGSDCIWHFEVLVFGYTRRPRGNGIEDTSFPPPTRTSLFNICLGHLHSDLPGPIKHVGGEGLVIESLRTTERVSDTRARLRGQKVGDKVGQRDGSSDGNKCGGLRACHDEAHILVSLAGGSNNTVTFACCKTLQSVGEKKWEILQDNSGTQCLIRINGPAFQ